MHVLQQDAQAKVANTEQVMGLVGQRRQLASEIEDLQERRLQIVQQLKSATGTEKKVLEVMGGQVDEQLVGAQNALRAIESLIATRTGAPAPPGAPLPPSVPVVAGEGFAYTSITPSEPAIPIRDAATFGIAAFAMLAIAGAAVFHAVRRLRRDTTEAVQQLRSEIWDEMKKVSVGVDAIAVELERIGEGQRFVTKAIAEKKEQASRGV